jgi:small subunit ribosomal protein S3Ae
MTAGKSKKAVKGKKLKKKVDHMAKKVWFEIKAPTPFTINPLVCRTIANKTVGTRTEEDNLKGRVFETSVGDLMNDEEFGFQVVRLKVEDVKGKVGYTQFDGMRFTTDKMCSLVKKWHTQLTAKCEVTTSDGFVLRVFSIAYTKKRDLQLKKTSYAARSQIEKICHKMREIITKTISPLTIKEVCNQLMNNLIGIDIAKSCAKIYPLTNSHIYKVKVLKAPKLDIQALQADLPTATTSATTTTTTATTAADATTTKQQGDVGVEVKQK